MLFTLTDVILIVIVFGFAFIGFMMGLISAVGSLIGVILGYWAANSFYIGVGAWLSPYMMGNEAAANVVAFILIFALVNRALSIIFWLVNKIFNLVSIIPFLGSINKLAGAILGFVEGVIATGIIIYFIVSVGGNLTWLVNPLNDSQVAHWLIALTGFITSIVGSIF